MLRKILKQTACTLLHGTGAVRNHLKKSHGITVLLYHRIDHEVDPHDLTIRPEQFEEQLYQLKQQYEIISLDTAVNRLNAGTIQGHSVVITFDDGFRDNYLNAFPLLQRYQVPATIFITCDCLDSGQFHWCNLDRALLNETNQLLDLSRYHLGIYPLGSRNERIKLLPRLHSRLKQVPDSLLREILSELNDQCDSQPENVRLMVNGHELRELQKSDLITIGAHTLSHPILTRVSPDRAHSEIMLSKKILERATGKKVDFFSYPNGGPNDFNDEICNMVKTCGYRAACTTLPGVNRHGVDPYVMRRIEISNASCSGVGNRFSASMFSTRVSGLLQGTMFRQ